MDTSVNNQNNQNEEFYDGEKKLFLFSIGVSLLLHIFFVVIPVIIFFFYSQQSLERGNMLEFSIVPSDALNDLQENLSEANETEERIDEEIIEEDKIKETQSKFMDFTGANSDTSQLNQIYNEPTLNVTVRYPAGWVFIDQNRKDKLDGVTFWSSFSTLVPPPYIHIEVKEKYLFNENRFRHKKEERNFTLYYNEPEEMEGEFTQIVYLRTNADEDYSIKLIINGEESFRQYQPVFFGMVKTFTFGKSLF